jgi:hypothetical protein
MRRTYAVVWCTGGDVGSGRLDRHDDRFELHGRDRRLSIPFSGLVGAAIARGQKDRLRGLPVLALDIEGGPSVRIASLEGPAVLHELADRVAESGLKVVSA